VVLPRDGGVTPLVGLQGEKPSPVSRGPGFAAAAVGTLSFGAVLGPDVGDRPAVAARLSAHIAAATCSAADRSSSSVTFGSTSSQSGSIIPDASTMPSGLGTNQTWKCAPPSPQR
jgi:hypothetical protein